MSEEVSARTNHRPGCCQAVGLRGICGLVAAVMLLICVAWPAAGLADNQTQVLAGTSENKTPTQEAVEENRTDALVENQTAGLAVDNQTRTPPVMAAPLLPYKYDIRLFEAADGPLAVFYIDLDEPYHIYSHDPGPGASPTRIKAEIDGRLRDTFYPPGQMREDVNNPGHQVETYQGRTPFFIPLQPYLLEREAAAKTGDAGLGWAAAPELINEPAPGQEAAFVPGRVAGQPDRSLTLNVKIRMLVCSATQCLPVRDSYAHTWRLDELTGLPKAANQPWFGLWNQATGGLPAPPVAEPVDDEQTHNWDLEPRYLKSDLEVSDLGRALIFAFLAGLILNFMPCVLPVVGLKLKALMAARDLSPDNRNRQVRKHCLYFGLGAIAFFIIFGTIMVWADLAWGHIFQNVWAVYGMAALVFILGLSLFGLFSLPTISLTPLKHPTGGIRRNALLGGFFATLLATPCSGPLLGGVLAWTMDQPPTTVATVFFTLGVGMASPFLALAAHPAWVRLVPKAGRWTLLLEHLVGFCLLATGAYLLSIVVPTIILTIILVILSLIFALWLFFIVAHVLKRKTSRLTLRLLTVVTAGLVAFMLLRPGPAPIIWESFDIEGFKDVLGKEIIMLEFTADWCPNCKLMEATSLTSHNLRKWSNQVKFRPIRVDMTKDNAEETALLHALGSRSIPLVAIFPQGPHARNPIVLRDIATSRQIKSALRQATRLSNL